jgi:hypothetical protein
MKVLGITETEGSYYTKKRAYIVQITHDELAKVADKAGYRDDFPELKAGQDYPIDEGYDFRREIVDAVKQMQAAHEKFSAAAATMARFASLVIPRADAPEAA